VDVRILAATNKDLTQAIARREFRADLYDRLSEVVIETAPLRCRPDDVVVLARYFARLHARRHRVRVRGFMPGALRTLAAYSWPGNVRELEKTISRAVVFAAGRWVEAEDLQLPPVNVAPEALDGPVVHGLFETPPLRDMALQLAARHGDVRRRDLVECLGISRAAAERELAALVRAGLLRRSGRRGGVRYAASHG
jgi:DNA-binding NtrC family response regulator